MEDHLSHYIREAKQYVLDDETKTSLFIRKADNQKILYRAEIDLGITYCEAQKILTQLEEECISLGSFTHTYSLGRLEATLKEIEGNEEGELKSLHLQRRWGLSTEKAQGILAQMKNDEILKYSYTAKYNAQTLKNFVSQYAPLTKDIENDVNCLVLSNLLLVIKIAKERASSKNTSRMGLMDLIQGGNIGLKKGCERFDPNLGFKPSTYISQWIFQSISKPLHQSITSIHFPHNKIKPYQLIRDFRLKYYAKHGEQPSIEEIAQTTEIPIYQVKYLSEAPINLASLNQTLHKENSTYDDRGETLQDTIHSSEPTAYDTLVNQKIKKSIRKKILELKNPRDHYIITSNFGIDKEKKSLKTIGDEFGISRERVRQLRNNILRKWKHDPVLKDLL